MKKLIAATFMFASTFALAATPTARVLWTANEGLAGPESVVYSEKTQSYFVSNVNGEGNAKDDNGFISLIDLNGKEIVIKNKKI